jgi:photosystem II stability/assembly factor-like uncharacterized protein
MKTIVLFVFSAAITVGSLAQDNWTPQTPSGFSQWALAIKTVDPNIGWCVNIAGVAVRTTDGGVTWVNRTSPGVRNVWDMDAVDANIAIVISSAYPGGDASIHRTTDGGATWQEVYSDMTAGAFFDAIKMYDAMSGVVLGNPVSGKWTILKTTNGGATWNQMPTAPPAIGIETGMVHGLATFGSSHMWFTPSGQSKRVYRSTDGGATWGYSDLPFEQATPGVWFVDANVGIVVANNGEAARTTDGGVTWKYIDFPLGNPEIANGVSGFQDNIFVTQGKEIYRSTDKGLTWRLSYAASGGIFYGLSITVSGKQVRGWAVGSDDVFTMFSETLTSTTRDGISIPSLCRLDQNYPNPFNPSTTIRYGLPNRSHVTLTVFNTLGQQVAQLVNGDLEAGYHEVKFDGSKLASGVYLYRMEAGTYVETRKLLLVR